MRFVKISIHYHGVGIPEKHISIIFDPYFSTEQKVIVSSGYSEDPVMTKFWEYGISGALPKPYKIRDLIETLKKITTDAT